MFELDWLTRAPNSRAISITGAGVTNLVETFGIDVDGLDDFA